MSANRYPSPSQRALHNELRGEPGEALRRLLEPLVHRTQLWTYATGRRRPEDKAKAAISEATDGRISVEGWLLDTEQAEIASAFDAADESPVDEEARRRRPSGETPTVDDNGGAAAE